MQLKPGLSRGQIVAIGDGMVTDAEGAHAQGLASAGPRQAFAQAFQLGWIEDETVWFDILLARNQAVHVYRETAATALATELPRYLKAFEQLIESLSKAQ